MKHKEMISELQGKLEQGQSKDVQRLLVKIDRLFKEYHQKLNAAKLDVTRMELKHRDLERKYESWLKVLADGEEVFDRDEYSQGWESGYKAGQGSLWADDSICRCAECRS